MIAILLLALVAADPVAPTCPLPVTVEQVHDGDTLAGTIHLPYGVDLARRTIRAAGYDAWEVTKTRQTVDVTDQEIVRGKQARDDFAALVRLGQLYVEDSGLRDPYGRTSAVLWVKAADGSWIFVAAWMEEHGHLRAKRQAGHD